MRKLMSVMSQLSVDLCKLIFASFKLVFQVGVGEFKALCELIFAS